MNFCSTWKFICSTNRITYFPESKLSVSNSFIRVSSNSLPVSTIQWRVKIGISMQNIKSGFQQQLYKELIALCLFAVWAFVLPLFY